MTKEKSPLGNLVWIDLEMTGLNVEQDVILEIALIITDGQLNIIHEGPELVIHHSDEVLNKMGEWVQETHGKSGLTETVKKSEVTTNQAQEQVLSAIKKYCEPQTASLAGNSVWQDRIFLKKYMPDIVDYLYYRLIDVTTVKELVARWYPKSPYAEFEKKESHRALQDIRESIAELAHYRTYFFK